MTAVLSLALTVTVITELRLNEVPVDGLDIETVGAVVSDGVVEIPTVSDCEEP